MSFRVRLGILLAVGLAIRVVLTDHTAGNVYDLGSLQLVGNALVATPGQVYRVANLAGVNPRWPYPPGYFPIIIVVHALSALLHIRFVELIRLPPALADLAIAWMLQDQVRFQGGSDRTRLFAAALVALGPSFIAISGVHGQLDSVGILPALIGVCLWQRWSVPGHPRAVHRAWVCGLLIGVGADIKVVPALMVFALLPSTRSRREAVTLIGAVAVLPLISIVPWIIAASPSILTPLIKYHGGTGLGGIGLLVQPVLATDWLHLTNAPLDTVAAWLQQHGGVIALVTLLASATVLYLRRVGPAAAACVIWLTVYVFGIQFFMQYMVWGLTFFIFAGYRRSVLALQALLFFPVLCIYHGVRHVWVADVLYIAPMIVLWLTEAGALGLFWRRLISRAPGHGTGTAGVEGL